MMRAMFAAISGLKSHQTMLDVTANNIANVNTVGYKTSRATFKDSLSQLQIGAAAPGGGQGGRNAAQVGLGVQIGSIDNLMTSGSLQSTGNVTDLAIQGPGMFIIGAGTPPALPASVEYTRAGNLTFDSAGFLTTQDGNFVLGRNAAGAGAPNTYIQVPEGATDISIGQDGAVTYVPSGGGPRETAGYLSIATFANEAGLVRTSGNRWIESAASGAANDGTPGGEFGLTISGTLEMSNVDLATEFTDMIAAQRGFQASSRVISTADEMLQDLVNLKR
ncbi:MAG TPA: flagellar hook-basal body complex protein [Solirubrobacterales bacterium]|nr:flagellar hook-basal body complex protein [Solirubrobacterales bacterium]